MRPRAEQRLRFIDENRSYIINYTHGKDLVRNYLAKRGATMEHPDKLWEEFERLLASPRLASGL